MWSLGLLRWAVTTYLKSTIRRQTGCRGFEIKRLLRGWGKRIALLNSTAGSNNSPVIFPKSRCPGSWWHLLRECQGRNKSHSQFMWRRWTFYKRSMVKGRKGKKPLTSPSGDFLFSSPPHLSCLRCHTIFYSLGLRNALLCNVGVKESQKQHVTLSRWHDVGECFGLFFFCIYYTHKHTHAQIHTQVIVCVCVCDNVALLLQQETI